MFRLNAILHHAPRAVQVNSGKGRGYCYMTERGPNSCFDGHVTELLICFYITLFLLSIFNTAGFRSIISCILLGTALADKNVIKELEVFTDGKILWNSGCLENTELQNFLPKDIKTKTSQKGQILQQLKKSRFAWVTHSQNAPFEVVIFVFWNVLSKCS